MRRAVRRAPALCAWGLLVLAFMSPAPSRAQIIDEEEVPRFTVGFMMGYAGNSMSRFNENIDVVNYFLTHQGIQIRTADRLNGGASIRGEARYKINDSFSLGMAVAGTESQSGFTVAFGGVDFYTRATLYTPSLYYSLPFVRTSPKFESVADRMVLYVGGGPVFIARAKAHMRITDRSREPFFDEEGDVAELSGEGDATGSGMGFQAVVGASYQLTRGISVAAEAGYRHARVSDLTLKNVRGFIEPFTQLDPLPREPGDQAVYDFFNRGNRADGLPDHDINGAHIPYYSDYDGPLDLDYSGVVLQVGLRLHLF